MNETAEILGYKERSTRNCIHAKVKGSLVTCECGKRFNIGYVHVIKYKGYVSKSCVRCKDFETDTEVNIG